MQNGLHSYVLCNPWSGLCPQLCPSSALYLLQIGRFDCEDQAARARDVASMSLGASVTPRLNFDADQYTLEAIKLMVGVV